jgi:hypothetical protein
MAALALADGVRALVDACTTFKRTMKTAPSVAMTTAPAIRTNTGTALPAKTHKRVPAATSTPAASVSGMIASRSAWRIWPSLSCLSARH